MIRALTQHLPPKRELINHLNLIKAFVQKDIFHPHKGHLLGVGWVFLYPLIFFGVYIFIFHYIVSFRLDAQHLPMHYAAYILSGLAPWMGIQVSLTKSANALVEQTNLVKQVAFPIEIIPIKAVVGSMVTQLISFLYLGIYLLAMYHTLPPTLLLLPVLFVMQVMMLIGFGLILSISTPYIHDAKEFVSIFCGIGVYLAPVMFLPEWLPDNLIYILQLNPFTHVIFCYQDIFYYGAIVHPYSWLINLLVSIFVLWLGIRLFTRIKVYLGNVL